MHDYSYHDTNDKTIETFIQQHSPHKDYWDESEKMALAQAGGIIERLLKKPRSEATALDAGCGEGRLLPWLSGFAQAIDAIDPDAERLEIATKHADTTEKTNITYRVSSIVDIDSAKKYDIILCSHVIQHVSTNDLPAILRQLQSTVQDDGLLVLTFSKISKYLISSQKLFSTEQVIDGTLLSASVDEETFNSVASGDTSILPVHYIYPEKLVSLMADKEWKLELTWSFHAVEDGQGIDGNDQFINSSEENQTTYGRDMIMVWRRKTLQ